MTRSAVVVALSLVCLSTSRDSGAQCGAATSSCRSCHEGSGEGPRRSEAHAWHRDHAFADLCSACHGGDATSALASAAHAAMVSPLAEGAPACTSCHALAGADLAARYRLELRASSSAATSGARSTSSSPSTSLAPARPAPRWRDAMLAVALLGIAGTGARYVVRNERRRATVGSSS